MITTDDILKSHCNIICHQGVMDSGIAKQIRVIYPSVYNEYKKLCDEYGCDNILGIAHICKISADKTHYMANMFAQYDYLPRGVNHTDYRQFRLCCQDFVLSEFLRKNFYNRVSRPHRLWTWRWRWKIIKKIIEEEFAGNEWKVEIWKLN